MHKDMQKLKLAKKMKNKLLTLLILCFAGNIAYAKEKEADYSQYLIPTDGYIMMSEPKDEIARIEGSITKGQELNLADCLELAITNNPRIKAAIANSAAIKALKTQTIANYSPRLTLNSGLTRTKPDTTISNGMPDNPYTKYLLGTIGIKQMIYDFGFTQNQYSIDKLNHQASIDNIDNIVNDVIFQVKDSYYYLMLAIENRRVMEETVASFEDIYKQARAFYEVGAKAKIDVTIAEVNLEDARAKLIEAKYSVDIATSRLNNAMGLPFLEPYEVVGKLPFNSTDFPIKRAIEYANEFRPDLKMALSNIKVADQYVKLAKKSAFPKIEFAANLSAGGRDSFSEKNWYDLGGYLTFPTFNPLLLGNQVKEARSLYERQQFDTKSAVNNMYFEIQSTYAKLVETKERVPVAKLSVKKALENFDIAQGRYKVGLSDPIELKDAQLQYQNSQLAYLKTLYDYNSAKAKLEQAIGHTLTEEETVESVEIDDGVKETVKIDGVEVKATDKVEVKDGESAEVKSGGNVEVKGSEKVEVKTKDSAEAKSGI